MVDVPAGDQRALFAQPIDNDRIGVINGEAGETARIVGEHAVVVDGHEHRDVELEGDQVVVLTMTGSGVHRAGA